MISDGLLHHMLSIQLEEEFVILVLQSIAGIYRDVTSESNVKDGGNEDVPCDDDYLMTGKQCSVRPTESQAH